jgi:hypothetical protein
MTFDWRILGLMLFVLGAFNMIGVVGEFIQFYKISKWRITKGHILSSKVERSKMGTIETEYGSASGFYVPEISYQYEVQNQIYTSESILPNQVFSPDYNLDQATSIVDSYPVDALVDIYYNPKNPSHAALEKKDFNKKKIFFGLGLLIVGIIVFWVGGFNTK